MRNVCSVDGCDGLVKGLGLCNKHYIRHKKGTPLLGGMWSHGSPEDRFWRYVSKRRQDQCWNWEGVMLPNGYGRLSLGGRGAGNVTAHRFSCQLHHGDPPYKGAHVMHLCDNRGCVNPAHLRWCTPSENIKDAYDKGRKVSPMGKGEKHPKARLNEEQVRFIREHTEMTQAQLVRLLGCSKTAVYMVRSRKTWKHLD